MFTAYCSDETSPPPPKWTETFYLSSGYNCEYDEDSGGYHDVPVLPLSIPDGTYAGVTLSINPGGCGGVSVVPVFEDCNGIIEIIGIKLGLIIEHANIEDLGIYLETRYRYEERRVEISVGNGGDGDNYGNPAGEGWDYAVVFTPTAEKSVTEYTGGSVGEYRPQGDMNLLINLFSWTSSEYPYIPYYYLDLYDQNANGISGTLTWAELELTYACYEAVENN